MSLKQPTGREAEAKTATRRRPEPAPSGRGRREEQRTRGPPAGGGRRTEDGQGDHAGGEQPGSERNPPPAQGRGGAGDGAQPRPPGGAGASPEPAGGAGRHREADPPTTRGHTYPSKMLADHRWLRLAKRGVNTKKYAPITEQEE